MPYNKPNLQPGQFALYAINRILNTTYKIGTAANGPDYDNPAPQYQFINTYIPITYYDGHFSSKFSTYDENLSIEENSQYSLSFSIAKYLDGEINPNFYLIVENRRLRLQTYDKKIDFVITGITPTLTTNNVVYSVTCQDAFSYDTSKQNTTIDFETVAPQNIKELASGILTAAQLTGRWQVDPQLESNYYADFPSHQKLAHNITSTTYRMKASMSIQGSTPYNALVELCKKFNASLEIEYSDKETSSGTIYFKNKMTSAFNGYHLRESVNLSAFSVSRKTDNLCSIMHVIGGEDADEQLVSITPTMPAEVQEYFTMLRPYIVDSESEKQDLFLHTSYPYIVVQLGDTCKLYQRYKNSSTFLEKDSNYIPWTAMTTEQIENDFNNFKQVGSSALYFSTAGSLEVNEYFNFLKYRCKAAASFFYDFSYFLQVGLMDQNTFDNLEKLFSIKLRNANIILYCLNYQYNILSIKLRQKEDMEQELIAQLCALEKELFDYQVNPDLKPEVVNTVIGEGDESALSRTTLEAANQEARAGVLSSLMTEVWTDEYFKLLLTLKGSKALENKLKEYNDKYKAKQEVYDNNVGAAKAILDTKAAIGTIVFQDASDIPSLDNKEYATIVYANIVGGTGQAGFTETKKGEYTLYYNSTGNIYGSNSTKTVMYNNAVLYKIPAQTGGSWPADEGMANLTAIAYVDNTESTTTSVYSKLDIKIYTRTSTDDTTCKIYHFTPQIATSKTQREEYLAENNQTEYVNYSVAKKKYEDALRWITEVATDTDPSLGRRSTSPTRRGRYSMMIDYLTELLNKPEYGYIAARNKYSTPLNLSSLLTTARDDQYRVWGEIYRDYNDYIIETNFTDSDQLSSEGLFMAAMEAFSKHKTPTYEYSTTVIDARAIANIESHDININDIVYAYNKDISSEYVGVIKVTVPRDRIGEFYVIENILSKKRRIVYSPANEVKLAIDPLTNEPLERIAGIHSVPRKSLLEGVKGQCLLYCRNKNYNLFYDYKDNGDELFKTLGVISRADAETIATTHNLQVQKVVHTDNVAYIYITCPTQQAIDFVTNRASIDTLEFFTYGLLSSDAFAANHDSTQPIPVYTNVLNIELEERAKPIPLQITGITKKLREATSQLTVSTDRTMDLVYQRLIKQARL